MKSFTYRYNRYRLERSPHCFTLSRVLYNEKKQEDSYTPICYADDLFIIIKHLFNLHVLDDAEHKSLLECIRKTKEELKALVQEESI